MRLGRNFERPILEMWAEDNPEWSVFTTGTYSGAIGYMQASPDAIAKNRKTGEWVIVEIKTARYAWTEAPESYRAQVRHYMDVMGVNRAVIVALAGWNWFEEWVTADQWELDSQRVALDRFWNCVQTGTAPDWDGSDSTYETVRKLHPDIDPELEVEIDGGHLLANLNSKFEQAKAELNEAKSRVLNEMGKARRAYFEHDGEKHYFATRQARGTNPPFLVVKK
jgi:hypothetical protein